MSHPPVRQLASELISLFGPIMGGQDLYSALGFKTYAAFHRCHLQGDLGVHIFKLPGRRGWYAFTTDIANWLEEQSTSKETNSTETQR